MNTSTSQTNRWTTSAFSEPVDSLPMELSALSDHLARCNGRRSRLFGVQCMAEAVHGRVAPRFVTTLLVATLVLGVGSIVL